MPRHDYPNPETDPFRPPAIPTEVCCMHCGGEYESYLIEWQQELVDGSLIGFWCCPTEGCEGKGFGFDIFPTDPDYRGEDGEPMWADQELDEFDDLDELELEMEPDHDQESDEVRRTADFLFSPDVPFAQMPPLIDMSDEACAWVAWDEEFDPFNRRKDR